MSINNNFVDPEVREKRGVIANGTYQNFQITNNDGGTINGVLTYAKNPKGRNGAGVLTTDLVAREARFSVSNALSVEYSIKLSQLFPELFPFQIPLFILDDQIQLHLTFTSDAITGPRGIRDTDAVNDGTINIVENEVKLHSNHLYFGDDVMDKLKNLSNSQSGIVIPLSLIHI